MYMGSKRKTNKRVDLFLGGEGDLVTKDTEEFETLKVVFFSGFTY